MLISEIIVTSGLVILIWIIQLLHYPSFRFIREDRFTEFSRFHSSRISMIVIPLMITELILGLISKNLITIITVGLIWLSTFTLQVPCHNKLQKGYDEACIDHLIRTNWIRTILWTLKFLYLLSLSFTVVE